MHESLTFPHDDRYKICFDQSKSGIGGGEVSGTCATGYGVT